MRRDWQVYSDGLSALTLAAWHDSVTAAALPLIGTPSLDNALRAIDAEEQPHNTLLLASDLNDARLARACAPPHTWVVETSDDLPPQPIPYQDYALGYALFTSTVLAHPVASLIIQGLSQRLHWDETLASRVELALHEALLNTALHSNLEIAGTADKTAKSLDDYYFTVKQKLHEATLRQRRVIIGLNWNSDGLEISIIGAGLGYTLPEKLLVAPHSGLGIIQASADSFTINQQTTKLYFAGVIRTTPRDHNAPVMLANTPRPHLLVPEVLRGKKIIIADDIKATAHMLEAILRRQGFYNIQACADGWQVLQVLREQKPDLLILDVLMPGLDGFEICKAVRADKTLADCVVLIETALSDNDARAKAFAVGANDYVAKPFFPDELVARVITHLQRQSDHRALTHYQTMMESELAVARRMQHYLLPSEAELTQLSRTRAVRCEGYFAASQKLSGDLWGAFSVPSGVGVYLVDFCGHGLHAALNTFRFHALIQAAIVDEAGPSPLAPAAFTMALNQKLCAHLPTGVFATFFYVVVQPELNIAAYVAAGQAPFLHWRSAAEPPTLLTINGLPLGIRPNQVYQSQTVTLAKTGGLLLLSDAWYEAEPSDNIFLSPQEFWQKHGLSRSLEETYDYLQQYHAQHQSLFDDDITLVRLALD